ncbi:hypothetical protein LTR10_001360 [Elasticomyces elasticus]|nr:hypothetical protein LTR10_001360 [Elasticomyces elasticus]KAK4965276.1 Protein SOSEKI 1 [Elasticomyces elasticus]
MPPALSSGQPPSATVIPTVHDSQHRQDPCEYLNGGIVDQGPRSSSNLINVDASRLHHLDEFAKELVVDPTGIVPALSDKPPVAQRLPLSPIRSRPPTEDEDEGEDAIWHAIYEDLGLNGTDKSTVAQRLPLSPIRSPPTTEDEDEDEDAIWHAIYEELGAPAAPITRLDELDIPSVSTHAKLRHNVSNYRRVHFGPNSGGSKQKARSTELPWEVLEYELWMLEFCLQQKQHCANASEEIFWNEVLCNTKYSLSSLFETIRIEFSAVVPECERKKVRAKIDAQLIMQELRNGVCDLIELSSWLAKELKKHCALMRDVLVDQMAVDIQRGALYGDHSTLIDGLRQLLMVLDSMKIDVASHQARHSFYNGLRVYEDARPWQSVQRYEPQINGRLGAVEVSCLADRGAGRNIISREYVQRLGIPVRKYTPLRARIKATLGNGSLASTTGLVTLPFSFSNETKVYQLEFPVMPKCVRDVILGSPFLRLTQTFERFAHRIQRTLRRCMPYRIQYLGSAERVVGTLSGSVVDALPDTGSDVMLISETYAHQRGFSIDTNEIYQVPLQLADGSLDWTSGIVKDVTWAYGLARDETVLCDFYVLPTLMCDVLLSYDFLDSTEAFKTQQFCFKYDDEALDSDEPWTLSTITKVPKMIEKLRHHLAPKPGSSQAISAASTLQETLQTWQREQRRLLRAFELNESQVSKLPPEQQDNARATDMSIWQPAYDKHMRSRPGS